MRIKCIDNKIFELTDGSENLGRLRYEGFFTIKAEIAAKNSQYKIIPKGIFSTEIAVAEKGSTIAVMKMNWKGNILLSYNNGEEYILKPTGAFMSKYAIEDKNGNKILVLDPDINWVKFNYNYTVLSESNPEVLLILLAAYATNYYIMVMTAVL